VIGAKSLLYRLMANSKNSLWPTFVGSSKNFNSMDTVFDGIDRKKCNNCRKVATELNL
jgi:hypothetical protein